jgi:hypothetical protein
VLRFMRNGSLELFSAAAWNGAAFVEWAASRVSRPLRTAAFVARAQTIAVRGTSPTPRRSQAPNVDRVAA